jgi:hypothetical protein
VHSIEALDAEIEAPTPQLLGELGNIEVGAISRDGDLAAFASSQQIEQNHTIVLAGWEQDRLRKIQSLGDPNLRGEAHTDSVDHLELATS